MSVRNKLLAALIAVSCATAASAGVNDSTGPDANGDGIDDQFTVNVFPQEGNEPGVDGAVDPQEENDPPENV